MSAPDISSIQSSIVQHVGAAVGTGWNILDGAPRGYAPPQINIWWQGVRSGPPLELHDVTYTWIIRVLFESAADPDRQDGPATAWEAIFNEWTDADAISCGGQAQLSFPSQAEPIEVEESGMLYVGIDITLTVIVKKARVFTP